MRKLISSTAAISFFFLISLSFPSSASSTPFVSGSISTSSAVVAYGQTFTLNVAFTNLGTAAYCTAVNVSVPTGFIGSRTSVYLGDLRQGESKSLAFPITAPRHATIGSFSALIFYSDNFNCVGTSSVASFWPVTVSVERGNLLTFTLFSVTRVAAARVSVYDSAGQFVTSGVAESRCTTCPTEIQVNVLSGQYTAKGIGAIDGDLNAVGQTTFTVERDKSIVLYLIPI